MVEDMKTRLKYKSCDWEKIVVKKDLTIKKVNLLDAFSKLKNP